MWIEVVTERNAPHPYWVSLREIVLFITCELLLGTMMFKNGHRTQSKKIKNKKTTLRKFCILYVSKYSKGLFHFFQMVHIGRKVLVSAFQTHSNQRQIQNLWVGVDYSSEAHCGELYDPLRSWNKKRPIWPKDLCLSALMRAKRTKRKNTCISSVVLLVCVSLHIVKCLSVPCMPLNTEVVIIGRIPVIKKYKSHGHLCEF